jgi:hypothetical protein
MNADYQSSVVYASICSINSFHFMETVSLRFERPAHPISHHRLYCLEREPPKNYSRSLATTAEIEEGDLATIWQDSVKESLYRIRPASSCFDWHYLSSQRLNVEELHFRAARPVV